MADLESLGFLASPHTSAGRVPTAKGYRFFVDTLVTVRPVDSQEMLYIKRCLDYQAPTQGLAATVSQLLSGITSMAGLVMLPKREDMSLRHIEFLSLSDRRVLAILVISEQEVQNKIIHTERQFSAAELQQAANYLNHLFAGKDMVQVRAQLLKELRDTRNDMDRVMRSAIAMAEQVFAGDPENGDFVVAGQTNLMEFEELASLEKLRGLFEAFNEKRHILHLLDQCMVSQGVQIYIGEESGYQVLERCSLVTSAYRANGKVLGVVGVIGPTRMAYERVIPLVDATARLISSALNQSH
jgi:heat-inducible transcriptional repressor